MSPENPVSLDAETIEHVLGNFDALLSDVDFTRELQLLGVGRLDFLRRKQMLLELRGLYMGLWYLALCRSFPDAAEDIFAAYLLLHAERNPGKAGRHLRERATQYKDMLHSAGDQNFTTVSRHILSFYHKDEETLKSLSLRLALNFRATYTFLFERLL